MAPRIGERYNTSIPRRTNELNGSGPSDVISYQLSDEELAKYRALPVPDMKGKIPVGARIARTESEEQRRRAKMRYSKEENNMPVVKEGPSCGLTKEILIEQVAKGETLSSVERAWGMKYNTIHNWVKKWGLKGINQAKAQDLLNPTLSAADKLPKIEDPQPKTPLLRERDLMPTAGKELVKLRQANTAIKAERDRLLQERDDYKQAAEDLEAKASGYDEQVELLNQTKARLNELEMERGELLIKLETANQTIKRDPNSAYETLVDLGVLQEPADPVNHPIHYTRGGIECIDAIEAATAGLSGPEAYSTGAAIKYLWRWKWKNGPEDLQKAAWYINRLIGE
ncbi:MAG: DUF3310 domain-containing protein [Bacillota bacterium]